MAISLIMARLRRFNRKSKIDDPKSKSICRW